MEKLQSKSPAIRFPEFKNTWQHKKLSEFLKESKKRNSDLKYGKEHVLSVSGELGIVNQIEHLGRSYAGVSVHQYHVVEVGDIVYTKSPLKANPFGIIRLNKTKAGIVSTLYAVYNVKEQNAYGPFLDYYFSLDANTNRYLRPLVKKGAKNDMKINNAYVLHDPIYAPSIPEQKRIASFFKVLDKKIVQLREKKTLLEEYKKGVVQQLFSQELKFKDEHGNNFLEWESYKLGKILKRYSNPVEVDLNESYKQIGIKSHGKGLFHKEAISGKELGNKRVFWIAKNMLILNIVFAWERAISKTTVHEMGMIASHRFPMYQPVEDLLDLDFIVYFFLTAKGKILLEIASPGGAGRNKTLGQASFEKLKISIPSLKEQIKISRFLLSIDKRLDAARLQYDELREYKNGLIQKMYCV